MLQRIPIWPRMAELRTALAQRATETSAAGQLAQLVQNDLDDLPLPGGGATLARWQALAAVASHDLSLAKLYEGHTDAHAVLRELDCAADLPRYATWGLWASEPPDQRVRVDVTQDSRVTLWGVKPWCSGAASVSHGLLTAWLADGRGPQLVRVAMDQPGITVSAAHWHAVGMADSSSLELRFDGAEAELVGQPGEYLARPGFWQGGAGVAACWYGGAMGLAVVLRQAAARGEPFRLAALGKVDVALQSTAALFREAAAWIDRHPAEDAMVVALRLRQAAETTARLVLDETGRALGATPFCRDARFARAAADLPVYIRQSHAERDFASLGGRVAALEVMPWTL